MDFVNSIAKPEVNYLINNLQGMSLVTYSLKNLITYS